MGRSSRRKPDQLAAKLVRIRKAVGGSQDDIVVKLGFAGKLIRERISEYELGKSEPPLEVLFH